MKEIEELLRKTMGLHAATVGSPAIERSVRSRMSALSIDSIPVYFELLRQSPTEWNALLESVVVTETWFFRDQGPFRALATLANEWLPSKRARLLKLLSIPCSTGEEPYSMAMAMLAGGFPEDRFQIDAIDIRSDAIAHAQHAAYGKNSFRGKDLGFRTRYFQTADKNWLLQPQVKNRIRFQVGNILDQRCLLPHAAYDFIFCRNLLIYFDQPTQDRVVRKLNALLTANGALFVGSAEVPILTRNGFLPAKFPLGFCCRKKEKGPPQTTTTPTLAKPEIIPEKITIKPNRGAELSADLNKARRLADEGRLAEAEKICERYLREGGVSAEAYFLLGLVRDAAGAESQAGEFYRKAVYLEPNHYEALQQWALLSEKTGNGAHARILNQRADRIKKQDENSVD